MKNFFVVSCLLLFLSCSTNNDTSNNNLVPSDFDVQVKSTTFNNVLLTWSQSFDPEEENVTYGVTLEGSQVVKGLSEQNYLNLERHKHQNLLNFQLHRFFLNKLTFQTLQNKRK